MHTPRATARFTWLRTLAAVIVALGTLLHAASPVSAAPSTSVVISQVYGGGGNSGATFKNDFIELYNLGSAPVSVAGWSVQYGGATGTTWSKTDLAGMIQPGKYYLIQQGVGAGGTANLPTPDASGTIAMSATAGKVALVNSTTALSGACPTDGSIVDFVGFGTTANCFEGTGPTPAPSNINAVLRANNGATDTDNNNADFTAGAPNPRNSSFGTTTTAPSITTQPQSQAIASGQTATLTVAAGGTAPLSYQWYQGSTGDTTTTVGTNSASFTTPALNSTTSYWVRVTNSVSTADSATAIITVGAVADPCVQPATKISSIQGSGSSAAVTGAATVQGVVTAIFPGLNTINVQEEAADEDGNSATSEGIAVFMGSNFGTLTTNLVVGDLARISGTAGERVTSGASQTQLSGTITVVDCGVAGAPVTPVDVSFPLTALNDLERVESMLVRFPQELFIAEYFNYDRFGEIVLGLPLDGTDRFYTPTNIATPGAAANALAAQYALRRITLDDGVSAAAPASLPHPNGQPFSATNSFRGGDTVAGQIGVIENTFGIYRVQPTAYGAYTAKNPRAAAPAEVGGRLKVASYNVLNYFLSIDLTSSSSSGSCGPATTADCRGADSATELQRQRSKLLQALKTINADVYGLIELENTTGVDPLADIVDGLNALVGAGTFAYINTGTIGTDAIKVGLIYKPATVTPIGDYKILTEAFDPRFNTSRNRPALAQTFQENATGARFTVVVNHLKSKGSACSGDPDIGDGQGNCNLTRTAAAQALVDWLATDPTKSGDSDFLIVGDLNAYAKEDPITAIKIGSDGAAGTADDYINLIESRLGAFAYSYVFDGQAGYLDHALASKTLDSQVTGVTDWHLNSDEPDIFDYNDAVLDTGESSSEPKGFDVTDITSPFRTSDHDPVIVGLNLTRPNSAPVANSQSVTVAENGTATITLAATDVDNDPLTYIIVSGPQNGTLTGTGANRTYTPAANFNGTDSFTFKVNDGTVDSNIATVSIMITPVNDPPVASSQNVTVAENDTAAITLAATDIDGDALTYTIVSGPQNGTLTGTGANRTYTPAANFNGTDSFTFKVNDGTVDSNIATVSITVTLVNYLPIANSQSVTTVEDMAKAVTLTATDADNDPLTYTIVSGPQNGTLSGSGTNQTYTPKANYNGSDSFTFTVNDGTGDSNIATVSITVTPVNDVPVASNISATTKRNTAVRINILTNSTDADGDMLSVSALTTGANGTVALNNGVVTYTPRKNFTGTDRFSYTVSDGKGGTATATVTVTVTK